MDRYWKINQTLLRKLKDTQYIVPAEEDESNATLEAFEETFVDVEDMERMFFPQPDSMAFLRSPNGVFIAFGIVPEDKKYVVTAEVDRIIKKLIQTKASTLYLILNGPLFHIAASRLRDIEGIYRIVIFRQDQLLFNPTLHIRVPKHVLLTPRQATEWLTSSQVKRSQMPRIFREDIQALYLDAIIGDLIAVTNPSPTVGEFTRHLVVVRRLGK
jgi:DNA-directed RNA polymerase subunit H (RpoH/RPB5)